MTTRSDVIGRLTAEGPFELAEDTSLGYPIRIYKNAPPSMRAVLEMSQIHGDKTFLVYGDETLTFQQHFARVASLAHFLRETGVQKGDRVAIGMRNYPEWMISFWACQALGAVAVALNAWWTGPEIAYALEDSTPAALLIDGERLERIAPLLAKTPLKALIVARREGQGGAGIDFSMASSRPRRWPAVGGDRAQRLLHHPLHVGHDG